MKYIISTGIIGIFMILSTVVAIAKQELEIFDANVQLKGDDMVFTMKLDKLYQPDNTIRFFTFNLTSDHQDYTIYFTLQS